MPAFGIGLGGYLPYDSWTAETIYTCYQTNRHSSGSFDFDPLGAPTKFRDDRRLDLSFGLFKQQYRRSVRIGNSCLETPRLLSRSSAWPPLFDRIGLHLHPFLGVRSAWIHQRYNTDYSDGNLILFGDGDRVVPLLSSISTCSAIPITWGFFWLQIKMAGKQPRSFRKPVGIATRLTLRCQQTRNRLFENLASTLETQSIFLKSAYWSFRPQSQIALGVHLLSLSFRLSDHVLSRECGLRGANVVEAEPALTLPRCAEYDKLRGECGSHSGRSTCPWSRHRGRLRLLSPQDQEKI